MRLLRKHKATLFRQEGGGVWNLDGTYESIRSEIPITCLVQPTFAGSQYQRKLPEGTHQKDCREIYTHHKLSTGGELTQTQADVIKFEGIEFEVWENNPWDSATGRLTHHRATMIRRDVIHAR